MLIYADIIERKTAEEKIRAARDAAETALAELQAAQAARPCQGRRRDSDAG